jgi:hypothetical protein
VFTAVVLPSPELGDVRRPELVVDQKRGMTGELTTYVKSSPRKTLEFEFNLSRLKALEVEAFLKIFYRAEWLMVLHDDTQWRTKLVSNELRRVTSERADGYPGGELVVFSLVVSGIEI